MGNCFPLFEVMNMIDAWDLSSIKLLPLIMCILSLLPNVDS